jgi:hypothetical protein
LLDGRLLPTYEEALQVHFLYHKSNNLQMKEAIKVAVGQPTETWSKAQVPTAQEKAFSEHMKLCWETTVVCVAT